jgi:hypothetical protein
MAMSDQDEFDGDACVVLPKNYLSSAEAVAEIYEDELTEAASNFEVDQFRLGPRFLKGTLLVPVLWAISSIWTVCV